MSNVKFAVALIVPPESRDYIEQVFQDCLKQYKVEPGAMSLSFSKSGAVVVQCAKPFYQNKLAKVKKRFDTRVHNNCTGKGLAYLMVDGTKIGAEFVALNSTIDKTREYLKWKEKGGL